MTTERWTYALVLALVALAVLLFAWYADRARRPPAGRHRALPEEQCPACEGRGWVADGPNHIDPCPLKCPDSTPYQRGPT